MAPSRIVPVFLTLLLVLAGLTALSGPHLLQGFGVPPELTIHVAPEAIPVSGSWLVTSCILYAENRTCITVDSTVKMIAFRSDKTSLVQTKTTVDGVASFPVPANTLGVRFEATYQGAVASHDISGPSVVPYDDGIGLVLLAISIGPAYTIPSWDSWRKLRSTALRKLLPLVSGISITLLVPLAYIVSVFPNWFGTGWLPVSFYGLPVYYLPVLSAVPLGIEVAWYTRVAVLKSGWRKVLEDFRNILL